jgi:hypothetical protein
MSDVNPVFEQMGDTQRDIIEWVVGKTFIIDYGVIQAVSSDGTHVDVTHAIIPTHRGAQLPARLTKGLELLFPGGGTLFSARWDVAVGDLVLLLALKDFVDPIAGISSPAAPISGAHYTPNTMKAIPLAPYSSSAKFRLVATGNTLTLSGSDGQTIVMDVSAHKVTINGNFEVDQ